MSEKAKIINLSFVNTYLIKVDGGFILIDTAMPDHFEKLTQALRANGCLEGMLKLVIITHGDIDHIGNCARLKEEYGAKIAIHEQDAHMCRGLVKIKRKARTLIAKLIKGFEKLTNFLRGQKPEFKAFEADVLLHDGQDLGEYGMDARVIHIAGHTKGSIGILTGEGDLFAGDMFVNIARPAHAIFIENRNELIASVEKLKKLNIRKIYPGHGEPFLPEEVFKQPLR